MKYRFNVFDCSCGHERLFIFTVCEGTTYFKRLHPNEPGPNRRGKRQRDVGGAETDPASQSRVCSAWGVGLHLPIRWPGLQVSHVCKSLLLTDLISIRKKEILMSFVKT